MGGRSSSSQSSATHYTDRRVAATDSAIVAAEGSTVVSNTLDGGAINSAFDFAEKAGVGAYDLLREWGGAFLDATGKTTEAINSTANRAFDFVEEARKDADERKFQQALPWLVLGVAVIAIAQGVGK